VLRYDVSVADGGAPFRVRLNRSVQNTTTGLQTIWGNESVRFVRVRQADGSGGFDTTYQRQPRGPPEIDPGIVAFQRLIAAGDYRVEAIDGEGGNRRIVLVATEPAPDAFADAPTNVTGYEGELVVDDRGRIRQARVEMEYVNARGAQLVSTVTYGIDRQGGVSVARPSWIDEVLAETGDFDIEARSVDGSYVEVTNTGSEPIGRNYTIAVATNSGAGVLEPNESIAPGESFYIYQPRNGTVRIGHEEPTDAVPLDAEFRIAVLTPDGERVADVVVEV